MSVKVTYGLYDGSYDPEFLVGEEELLKNVSKFAQGISPESRYVGRFEIRTEQPFPLHIDDELDYTMRSLCTEGVIALAQRKAYRYLFSGSPDEIDFTPADDRIITSGEEMMTENDVKFELNVEAAALLPALYQCAHRFLQLKIELLKQTNFLQSPTPSDERLEKAGRILDELGYQ